MREEKTPVDHTSLKAGLTRRQLLAGGAAFLATTSATACDALSTRPGGDDGAPKGTGAKGTGAKGMEAPSLAEQVKAGKLPPVKERLPKEPLVVRPVERIGTYGGEWINCVTELAGGYEYFGYEQLVAWDIEWTKVVPMVAKSWEVSDGGRSYTFTLREGMRWSDGEPFTADDVVFAYEDVLSNKELYPDFPAWLTSGDEPAQLDKVDDHTCRFTFSEPHAFFLQRLASPDGVILTSLPKHYLREFHKKLNPEVEQIAEQEGHSNWAELFLAKGGAGLLDLGPWQNTELPTLLAWRITTPLESDRLVVERNPYYWKTDPEGSQLPYLDRVVVEVLQDAEVAVLRTTEGRYTLPPSDILTPDNKPVFARERQSGGYHFAPLVTADTNYTTVAFNMTVEDPALREVFQNRDFRIALSHAIDREEIITAVYQRQGEPWQVAPRNEGDFAHETLAKQYTEFDVAKANKLLDGAGFTERGSDDIRLRRDGKPIRFTVEIPIGFDPTWPDVAEMIQGYWKRVGVQIDINPESTDLFFERTGVNKHQAVVYSGENGLYDAILDPKWYLPLNAGSLFATQWGLWYESGGEGGEKPSAQPLRQMELYDEIKVAPDEARQRELFMQILDIAREEFYLIGTVLPTRYNIVQNDFMNVPKMPDSWIYPDPAPARPEQYFRSA
jgi:ABC-type transport system substrate-binding protein